MKQPDSLAGYLWYVSGISYWIRAFQGIFKAALGNVTAPYIAEREALVVREARIFGLIYLIALGAAFAGYSESLLYWFLPMVMAQPFWRGWLLAEHTGCTNDDDIYANTRTTYTNPLLRFLLWQMPYHVAHHAYPGIPFFALQDADALIRGRAGANRPATCIPSTVDQQDQDRAIGEAVTGQNASPAGSSYVCGVTMTSV